MSPEVQQPDADTLAQAQRHRLDRHWGDQDRTLLAMQQLEAALATAAPRREHAWRDEVRRTLGVLAEAARDEASNAASPTASCPTSSVPSRGCRPGYAGCGPVTPSCGTASRRCATSWLPRAARR